MGRLIGGFKSTTGDTAFTGGNQSVADLKALAELVLNGNVGVATGGLFNLQEYYKFKKEGTWPGSGSSDNISPVNGGTLTVNSQGHGSYSYTRKQGNQTISSWTASDWFVNNSNSYGQIIAVNGNLTLNSGVTMNQSGVGNKLFTFIYVNGDMTIDGTVDWSNNGAKNHGPIGSNDLRITTDTRGGVTNPYIPGVGGSGGARTSNHPGGATAPAAPNDGSTGGGGTAGGWGGNAHTGPGGNGTVYTGGSGSGGARDAGNSGPGGNGGTYIGWSGQSPEGGNGHGTNSCGAVIIFFVTGTFSGSGAMNAVGGQGSYGRLGSGGGGGGGSITVICASDSSSITPNAAGGPANHRSGAGGAGTSRILAG